VGNQFETRTGIKGVTAIEAMACDPFAMAIVAPEPPKDIKIRIDLGDLAYEFNYDEIVGPNDSFERGLGWDGTFRWGQQSATAKAQLFDHVINNLAGHRQKPIVCHHEKGQPYPTVVEGRHSVLSERIANLIRVKQHKEPINVAFKRRRYDGASAAIAAEVGNLSYERDPLDLIEQRLYLINENGWDDATAAKHFRKSVATIRNWRKRVDAPAEQKRAKPKAPKRPARKMVERLFAAMKDDRDTPKESLEILHFCLTGEARGTVKKFLE
jgi:hypothetical protein